MNVETLLSALQIQEHDFDAVVIDEAGRTYRVDGVITYNDGTTKTWIKVVAEQ